MSLAYPTYPTPSRGLRYVSWPPSGSLRCFREDVRGNLKTNSQLPHSSTSSIVSVTPPSRGLHADDNTQRTTAGRVKARGSNSALVRFTCFRPVRISRPRQREHRVLFASLHTRDRNTAVPFFCSSGIPPSHHSAYTWEVTLGNKGEGGNNQVLQKNTILYHLHRIYDYHNGR